MTSIRDQLVSIICEVCRPDLPDLSDESKPLLQCGLDSLDFASVLMAMEDRFGLTIGDDDLDRLGSLKQIVAYLEQRVPVAA